MSLTNTHLDYQILTELMVFNSLGEPLPLEFSPIHLSQGKPCEWIQLLDIGL